MNPNEIKKLKVHARLPIVLIILLLFLPKYFVEPTKEEMEEKKARAMEAIKNVRASIREREENLAAAKRLESLQKFVSQVDSVLPKAEELPDVIDGIHKKAEEAGVSIENIVYQASDKYAGLDTPSNQLNMNVLGSYGSLKKFLSKIEESESPVIVDEVLLAANRSSYTVKVRVITK